MAAGTGAVVTGAGAFVLPASAVGGLAGVGSVLMENVDVGISRTPDSSGESNYPDWSPSDNDGDWSDTTMNDGGGNSLSQAAAADVAAAKPQPLEIGTGTTVKTTAIPTPIPGRTAIPTPMK